MLLERRPPAPLSPGRAPCGTAPLCRQRPHIDSDDSRPPLWSGPTETRPHIPFARTPPARGPTLGRYRRSGDVPFVLGICFVPYLSMMPISYLLVQILKPFSRP